MLNTSSMYEQFMNQVFEEDTNVLRSSVFNLQTAMEGGVTTAKHISMPSSFFMTLLNNMENDSPLLSMGDLTVAAKRSINSQASLLNQALPTFADRALDARINSIEVLQHFTRMPQLESTRNEAPIEFSDSTWDAIPTISATRGQR